MKDRFKFRVWKGQENRMVYDVTYLNPLILDPAIKEENKHNILMQCTGLKDKNGKLIYEGDIVKGEYLGVIKFGEYQGNFTHYIKWQRKYADLLRGDINYWIEYAEKSIKVIGNIYLDSHLLEN